ncbi:MAG TPA: glycosyltransferase family 87 protein [Dehalococcoidia bacterium]|nr:glycosyltransferase family 87 protein [Dehalococcoidia bacterium]
MSAGNLVSLPRLQFQDLPPAVRAAGRAAAFLAPLVFLFVLWRTDLPDAIDVYRTVRSHGDFEYLLGAGRLVTSDDARLLYSREIDSKAFRAEHGYDFPSWYPYPPSAALLTAPVSRLSYGDALDIWKAGIVVSALVVGAAAALAFDSWAWRAAVVVAVLSWEPMLLNVRIGQTGAFVAALVAIGLLIFWRWEKPGAAVLGLLGLKPSVAIVGALAIVPRSMRTWALFAAVLAAVMFVPFLWLGLEPMRQWLDILGDRSSTDLGGGHPYNFGFTNVIAIDSRAIYMVFVAILLGILVLADRLHRKLGAEASLAFALYGGLLLNPHSMLYDWPAAFAGLVFLRRSGVLRPFNNDLCLGLLAVALFYAGQVSWEAFREDVFRPLTLWAAAVVALVLVRYAAAEGLLAWRRGTGAARP